MVGSVLALALLEQGKDVLLLESALPQEDWLARPPLRVSAINLFSEDLLASLGVWQHIADSSRCEFSQLATWDKPDSKLLFDAEEIGKSHLGHLVRNEAIQLAAFKRYRESAIASKLTVSQMALESLEQDGTGVTVSLSDTNAQSSSRLQVRAKLIVGADGAMSRVRQLSQIGTSGWDYEQHCLSITIKTEFATQAITWQEFQPSGPKAFLPLSDGHACLIWYDAPRRIQELKGLSEQALKSEILATFPPLPGEFSVIQSASFPLTRRQANHYYKNRVVLVGDAAHTINPLAGQGVNLGFQDVAKLRNKLESIDWADGQALEKVLKDYEFSRKNQARLMSGVMDACYRLFSNSGSIRTQLRNNLLKLANQSQWTKKQVLKKAVGL